ncbi:MAG: hypothetical protein AABX88_00720 [Nanoarchaeota archaeon]
MVKIGIIGHAGRLGKPLVDILNKHPKADIVYTESRKEGSRGKLSETYLVFLALPYEESKKYILKLEGKKIIDLSIDHRNSSEWVYGLSELNKNEISKATRVANPGCYATSIILGLAPLKGNLKDISISSTSGISGAGLTKTEEDNFKIYKDERNHPQIKEIEKTLDLENILFVPQRIDSAERGIVSTIFAKYEHHGIKDIYEKFYESKPFVKIKDEIETKNIIGTNYCQIKVSEYGGKIVIISTLDNLIKGGAGQAVQNFNIMYGFDESLGLV